MSQSLLSFCDCLPICKIRIISLASRQPKVLGDPRWRYLIWINGRNSDDQTQKMKVEGGKSDRRALFFLLIIIQDRNEVVGNRMRIPKLLPELLSPGASSQPLVGAG